MTVSALFVSQCEYEDLTHNSQLLLEQASGLLGLLNRMTKGSYAVQKQLSCCYGVCFKEKGPSHTVPHQLLG